MSLNSADRWGKPGSAGSAAEGAGGGEKVPLLRAGGYAVWKPKMDRFLNNHTGGVHKKARTEASWLLISSQVDTWSEESLEAGLAAAGIMTSAAPVKIEAQAASSSSDPLALAAATADAAGSASVLSAEAKAGRVQATTYVERSIKAHNYLMNALDADVSLLVAHLADGWAYGLWMWLERKYQSTEPDNIAALLRRWVTLAQKEDESFDQYRARVNDVHTLLKIAKQEQTPDMYCLFLLDNLQPRYAGVVLALKNGFLLRDKANINWEEVTTMINAHERNDRQFVEVAASGAKAMAARVAVGNDATGSHVAAAAFQPRGRSPVPDRRKEDSSRDDRDHGSGSRPRSLQEVQCFNCEKFGHISRNCRQKGNGGGGKQHKKDEQASSLQAHVARTGSATQISKEQVCGVNVKKSVSNAPESDDDGWTVVRKSRGASGNKKGKESSGAGKPMRDAGERRQGATPATSAVPVRGDKLADGAAAHHPRPREVIKNGVNVSAHTSSAEDSTLAVSAVTSTAALPAFSDVLGNRDGVARKGIMKERTQHKRKPSKKKVSFDMRRQPPACKKSEDSVSELFNAQASAIVALPREYGIDSMASLHVVGTKELFSGGLRSCKPFTVTVANGNEVQISQVGSIELHIDVASCQTATFVIEDVYFHRSFESNLLSLTRLTDKGWKFCSSKEETYLQTPGDHLKVRLRTTGKVSVLRCSSGSGLADQDPVVFSVVDLVWDSAADLVRLHERLGHMGFDRLLRIIKANKTEGIGRLNISAAVLKEARGRVLACRACKQGKGTRTAFGRRGLDKGSAPGEALHMDTYYVKYNRADGTPNIEYGLTVTCPHTTFKYAVRAISKDLIASEVVEIIRIMQTQFGCTVKRLHTDGGTEFINQTLKGFCEKEGILLCYPPARTPELNSVAERQVRSGKDGARTLLMHAGLPERFGPRALFHFIWLWNRTNTAPLTGMTPYEAMFKKKPSVQHVSVFGCDAYYHVPKSQRGTFEAKMVPGIYLGHNFQRNCAIVYDLRTGQEVFTRDVEYLPSSFTHAAALVAGGEKLQEAQSRSKSAKSAEVNEAGVFDVERILGKRQRGGKVEYHVKWAAYDESDATWEPAENVEESASEAIDDFEAGPDAESVDASDSGIQSAGATNSEEAVAPDAPLVSDVPAIAPAAAAGAAAEPSPAAVPPPESVVAAEPQPAVVPAAAVPAVAARPARRSPRDHPSSASVDAGQQNVQMAMSVLCSTLPGGDVQLTDADPDLVCAVASGLALLEAETPSTYKEAMQSEHAALWRAATDKEMAGCEQMGVWELVPRTSVPKFEIITCKWVFKVKTDSSGAVEVYKARVTPKGFLQREGINFFETFAATGKYKSLRLGLMVTAACGHNLEQMDVPQAFLNADVDEEVYMELPEGYRAGKEHLVCKLKKALYGLKQAPRNWYLLISKFVAEDLGYTATVSDPCLFFRRSKTGRLMLLFLFVDDFQTLYHPEDKAEWDALKAKLVHRFKTKDLGASTWILGMRIMRDLKARTITLDQELYVTKALERHGMDQCKPVTTPGAPTGSSTESAAGSDTDVVNLQQYQEMVGTLMYSAVSCRPDISHAVQQLAQAMQSPTQQDVVAAKRVFRYLAGTKDIGLVFGSRCGQVLDTRGRNCFRLDVCCYADADWANSKKDRKSITGWVAKVNGDPISWASKKQRTVAQSTCEAELYAEAAAIQEVLWLRDLLKELGLNVQTGSTVYGDNQSTLAISKNGIKGERTKHVDVKYHFITETVQSGKVKLQWIPTTEQQADIFTKALAAPVFENLRKVLMTR